MTQPAISAPSAASTRVTLRVDNLKAPKKCTYRAIELANGARACLISLKIDPDAYPPESEIVISIGVGRLQDPQSCRGLAKLCLQLTLPEDASKRWSNIQTNVHDDITEFRMELNSSDLPEFMEKLSAGLRNPRFNESDIQSELKTGYYSQCMPSLDWLRRCSGNPSHPFNRLTQANGQTVLSFSVAELRGCLVEFHGRYYSGNVLRLAVEDSRSPDELEALVATTFGDVPNRSAPDQTSIRAKELEGVNICTGGVKIRGKNMNVGGVFLIFPVPDQVSLHKTSPDLYVQHLLRRDHVGSLAASLNFHGAMLSDVSLMDTGQAGFDSFCISVSSKDKKSQSVDFENTVIKVVFRYLAMIRSLRPQKWWHSEVRIALQTEFSPKPIFENSVMLPTRSSMAMAYDDFTVAARLQRFPLRDALSARRLLTEYSSQAIEDFLGWLTPNRCTVFVSDFGWNDRHECFYKYPEGNLCCQKDDKAAEFIVERLPPDLMNFCSAEWPKQGCDIDNGFRFPKPKPFVSSDISLRPRVTDQQPSGPRQLRLPQMPNSNSPNARLWFRQDDKFQSELAYVSVDLIVPIAFTNKTLCLLDLLTQMFANVLKNLKQQVDDVCLELSVSRSCNGIQVCCSGYSEPLPQLMATALRRIAELKITKENFQKARFGVLHAAEEPIEKEEEIKQLANQLDLAGFLQVQRQQEISDVKNITLNDLQSIASHFLNAQQAPKQQTSPKSAAKSAKTVVQKRQESKVLPPCSLFADILVYGNATAEDAIKAAQSILTAMPSLTSTTKMPSDLQELRRRECLLPRGSHNTVQRGGASVCVKTSQRDWHGSSESICGFILQIPTAVPAPVPMTAGMTVLGEEFGAKACNTCLLQMMLEAAKDVPIPGPFDRINRQIFRGYSANSFEFQIVTSQSPSKMEKDIETFIVKLGDHVIAMSPDALAACKQRTLQAMKDLVAPSSIEQQHSVYWSRITCGDFEFGWDDPRAAECFRAIVDGISKEDLINYWRMWFRSGSPDRSILSLQTYNGIAIEKAGSSGSIVTDLEKFKKTLESCPPPLTNCLKSTYDA